MASYRSSSRTHESQVCEPMLDARAAGAAGGAGIPHRVRRCATAYIASRRLERSPTRRNPPSARLALPWLSQLPYYNRLMPEPLSSIASLIDHALLHPTLSDDELCQGCLLADEHAVASVCVKPCHVALARATLANSSVAVGTVIGFPHGSSCIATKVNEAERALDDGAIELDAVVNVGKVLSEDWDYVRDEVSGLCATAHARGALFKLIFETAFLAQAHKLLLCRIAREHGADFVKTSTGFDFVPQPDGSSRTRGATDEDVRLMVQEATPCVKVKASGGMRTLDDVLRMRSLGAARVGTSSTVSIVREALARGYEPD
jgi:deoxyribose-phosphate aldolase